jgi:hypothetical protein
MVPQCFNHQHCRKKSKLNHHSFNTIDLKSRWTSKWASSRALDGVNHHFVAKESVIQDPILAFEKERNQTENDSCASYFDWTHIL